MDESLAPDFHIQASPRAAAIQKVVLKHEESFFVSDRRGDFPADVDGELGFYYQGTRHLRVMELRLNGELPLLLNAEVSKDNDQILVGLTNADIETPAGTIPRNTIYLHRLVLLYESHLVQSLAISSFHDVPCELRLEVLYAADFRDVFEVRGMHRAARGAALPEEQQGGTVVRLRYRGLDGILRGTQLNFDPPAPLIALNRAVYRVSLNPGQTVNIEINAAAFHEEAVATAPPLGAVVAALRAANDRFRADTVRIETDNEPFNALVDRSIADLRLLITTTPQGPLPYAGVPWFVAPFGRDSLITALQLLPYNAEVAAGTLRFLAAWQGKAVDEFRDEEPGKILHEYRRGEMANCREIPFVPYYGTIDATPLFLIVLAEYLRWTADLQLVRELWPSAQAALEWLRDYGDRDGDRYLEYATRSRLGLGNQAWKDSGDAVSHADGVLAQPPIAMVEVQGYAYAALLGAAEVARHLGKTDEAARALRDAAALQERFNRDFWMDDDGYYALALDGDKRRCEVISSNPGHCLWAGIVSGERAAGVAKRLLANDMFSGWGVRTLSSRERRYNPMSYHNGSVWPHDNALLAAGFRRYGLTESLLTVMSALFDASKYFEHARLPELFCGFVRHGDFGPIEYPVACSPQAWAAGSTLQLLTAMIGLQPDAAMNRLTCESPVLPPWLRYVELRNLRVGSSSVDLAITGGREAASVELLGRRGNVELLVRR